MERDESTNHMKQLKDVQDFTCRLECWFCHGRWMWGWKNERSRKRSLVSSLNLGSEEMPVEEYVPLTREEIVDAKYNMIELVDLALDR